MDEKNILKKQKESSIIIYQSADGKTKIDVKLENENIWLNQKQMSDLFGVEVPAVLKHIKNIFEVGELSEDSTISKMEIVQQEGERLVKREITFYNLDAIISVGYRVNSITAVHFRQWATQKLKEYIIKGFVLDDERLKLAKNNYFDELLERIRDIRSSEKV
ncbi:MAG: virulence RhuM family protein, partial [Elusimicrobiota bacterium]|nr:virulence RhuM family protein [Elusimicrobiota bacterium]